MPECKQYRILEDMRKKISAGRVRGMLPETKVLAASYGVNVKTMARVMRELARLGIVERRRRFGTCVSEREAESAGESFIEVVFEGFSSVFTHPFWSSVWNGMVPLLMEAGFRPVLSPLEADTVTGLPCTEKYVPLKRASARILLGIVDARFIMELRDTGVPVVTLVDDSGVEGIFSVPVDFTKGITDAVGYLWGQGFHRIGFLGQTSTHISFCRLHKFHAFMNAVQKYGRLDPALMAHIQASEQNAVPALEQLLENGRPDALILGFDHQYPGIREFLNRRGLALPVIGCDGLNFSGLFRDRQTVSAPLQECGRTAVSLLLSAVREHTRPCMKKLEAEFHV